MLASAYRGILYGEFFILFVELFLNAFTGLLFFNTWTALLIMHIFQAVFIVIVFAMMIFGGFANTKVWDAGMVNFLLKKFGIPIIIMCMYFGLTVGLYTWEVLLRWDDVTVHIELPGYIALYVFQKLFAVMFYYSYKRTALRLGDHRFYEDSDWLRNQFESRR